MVVFDRTFSDRKLLALCIVGIRQRASLPGVMFVLELHALPARAKTNVCPEVSLKHLFSWQPLADHSNSGN